MSSRGKKKKASQPPLTTQEKLQLLYRNGITAYDLKREFETGYGIARQEMMKICYAAVCLALKEEMHFGRERIVRVLLNMDEKVTTVIDSEEIMDEVFDKIGIQIDFREALSDDRITKKERQKLT